MAGVMRHYHTNKKTKVEGLQILDREKLTGILPEEIWDLIFKSFSSSVDLHNVAQASKYFESLLYPLRTQSLFPIVWQIITAKLITHGKWHSLLTLRSSCKTWSRAVDRYFEQTRSNRFVKEATDWNNEHFEDWVENSLRIWITSSSQGRAALEKFWKHFERTHTSPGGRSPFVDQTVSINCYSDDATDPHSSFPMCQKILSNYGKFVKHCSIKYANIDLTCQLLTLMSNLETISIRFAGFWCQNKKASSELTLPILPGLKNLEAINVLPCIVNHLVKNCMNLSTFVCFDTEFDMTGLLTNPLQHLRVCVDLNAYRVLKTASYAWPLTDLDLTFEENCCVKWPELFELLNIKWSATLKRLKLLLPTDPLNALNEIKWSYLPLLKLENLTHLTLKISNLHALDFILPVRHSLEYLVLRVDTKWYAEEKLSGYNCEGFKQNQKILCHIKRDRMIDSNIWTLFPKLKLVDHTSSGGRVQFFRASKKKTLKNLQGIYYNTAHIIFGNY